MNYLRFGDIQLGERIIFISRACGDKLVYIFINYGICNVCYTQQSEIRGYHVYQDIWPSSVIEERLLCTEARGWEFL